MRVILDERVNSLACGGTLSDDLLADLYAVPGSARWLRATMVATIDGSATGADGRSGSVNTATDHVVFGLLRALSHATLVGAGTVRDEGYGALEIDTRWVAMRAAAGLPPTYPLVVVSRSGALPEPLLHTAPQGLVRLVTCATSPHLDTVREALGTEHVHVCGDSEVDLSSAVDELAAAGLTRLLAEGGPSLLADLIAADLVDELDVSTAPTAVGGTGPRITHGSASRTGYALGTIVEQDGTLMTRWVRPGSAWS